MVDLLYHFGLGNPSEDRLGHLISLGHLLYQPGQLHPPGDLQRPKCLRSLAPAFHLDRLSLAIAVDVQDQMLQMVR